MALTKDQKTAQVSDLKDKMSTAQSVMFANYIGLDVSQVSDLRSKLREAKAEMKVAKKTLMKLAAKDAGLPEFDTGELDGPVSLIFSYDDPLSGAQVAFKFGKDFDQVKLIGGVFEGRLLTEAEAKELAQMPSRDVLLATFVAMIRSPLNNFAGTCSSPLSGFARALSEMAEKGGFGDEPAPVEEAKEEPKEEAKDEDATEEKAEATEQETEAKEEAPAEKAEADEPPKDEAPETADEPTDDADKAPADDSSEKPE